MNDSTPHPKAGEQPEPHRCRLTPLQVEYLMKAIDPSRVKLDPKGFKYVEQQDVRTWLNRVFGVGGWDVETLELTEVTTLTTAGERPRYTVIYRAQARLTVKAECGHPIARLDDGAIGDASNQPQLPAAHDNAMKSALSGALKRCAVNLGDAFGLGLYYDNIAPGQSVVQRMIPYLPARPAPAPEVAAAA
ncbi:Rad52/Rad22 family DNA repair protein (plasmid) [Streptomyces sp. BI20]|uniref:Rad52/Rad22 family DNA repair protein n=1 Tax=Streptomyces sp. BI20 TaxID=3403460 RepID=UPI003C776299